MEHPLNHRSRRCSTRDCLLLLVTLACGWLGGCSSERAALRAPDAPAAASMASTPAGGAAELGIEVVRAALAAQGMFVDFRYRVVDPEKAKFILHRTTTDAVALFQQTSGKGVEVFQGAGKLGKLKQTTYAPEAGRIYSMVFRNPGVFQAGDRLVLQVADFRVEGILLE